MERKGGCLKLAVRLQSRRPLVCGRSSSVDRNGAEEDFAQGGQPFAWWQSTVGGNRKKGGAEKKGSFLAPSMG